MKQRFREIQSNRKTFHFINISNLIFVPNVISCFNRSMSSFYQLNTDYNSLPFEGKLVKNRRRAIPNTMLNDLESARMNHHFEQDCRRSQTRFIFPNFQFDMFQMFINQLFIKSLYCMSTNYILYAKTSISCLNIHGQ